MAMAGGVPGIVVLALGAGALAGPDALRLLIGLAGRNPAVDIGISVFVFTIVTAQLLGIVLVSRFIRKPPSAGGAGAGRGAPATDPFARITLLLSLAAASLVATCLVLVSGGPGSVRPLVDFAAKHCYPTVIAAGGGGVALLHATPLLRVFGQQRNARGANPERATTTHHAAHFIGLYLAAAAVLVAGGLGSPSPLVDFAAKNPIVAAIVIGGGATAAGSLLRTMHPLRAFREQRNARGRAATTRGAARFIGLPLAAAAAAAAVCALLVAIPFGARGGLDALRLSPGFTNMAVAVAVAVVVGAGLLLLVRFYGRGRNAAGGGGGGAAASAPAAAAPRTRGASAK